MTAMGGMNITQTVEGLERYPVNLRYPHELRDNLEALRQTLVATPSGARCLSDSWLNCSCTRARPCSRVKMLA